MRQMAIFPVSAAPSSQDNGAPHDRMAHDILGPLALCVPWYWISRRDGSVSKAPGRYRPFPQNRWRESRDGGP